MLPVCIVAECGGEEEERRHEERNCDFRRITALGLFTGALERSCSSCCTCVGGCRVSEWGHVDDDDHRHQTDAR